jgi:hypothetical protein
MGEAAGRRPTMQTKPDPDVAERGGYSLSALARRGWSKAMIARWLGDADRVTENPQFPKGAPMRIYDVARVEAAEATEAFAAALAAKRST